MNRFYNMILLIYKYTQQYDRMYSQSYNALSLDPIRYTPLFKSKHIHQLPTCNAPLARTHYQARQRHLPDHTSPEWYRYILATIHLALPSCCHLPWDLPWTGSWKWGLRDQRLTSFCPYFGPAFPLRPCPSRRPRSEAAGSGRRRSWPGIHRVRAASLRMQGRPFCAGRPCVSPRSILGTCSSGGVCAWLANTAWERRCWWKAKITGTLPSSRFFFWRKPFLMFPRCSSWSGKRRREDSR